MSTSSVVASRFGSSLFFASWMGGSIDTESLRGVLDKHGLELLPGALTGNEFIAGQDLAPRKAARLAEDLRGIGLTVRVVNKTALTGSTRVGNAMAATLMGLMFTLPPALMSVADPVLTPLVLLLIPGLLLLLNAALIASRGGVRLALAGTSPEEDAEPWAVQEAISALKGSLPDHQLDPLLEKARALEAMAMKDPKGAAASELAAMRAEQQAVEAQKAEAEAKALRADLARARSAVTETGRS